MERGFRSPAQNGAFPAFALDNRASKPDTTGVDFCEITVTDLPIAAPPIRESARCGGIVDFWGVVRPMENGEPISGIEYTCHPRMTQPSLRNVVERSAAAHALLGCRLVHRVGFVPAGEASLFLRAACEHRDAAYAASRAMLEDLKRLAPIWKHPIPASQTAGVAPQ